MNAASIVRSLLIVKNWSFVKYVSAKKLYVSSQEADVLVNPIVNAATELGRSGLVSKAFYTCGQKDLQKVFFLSVFSFCTQ